MRKDDVTGELPGVARRRGRPPTGKALDGAARQRAYLERKKAEGKEAMTFTLPVDVAEAIRKHVEFKDLTLSDAVEKALRDRFLRKR